MFKKLASLIAVIALSALIVSCKKSSTAEFKIGIVTPSLSSSEEEFRAADALGKKYPGMMKHIVLPDNFSKEQETGITQIASLADDKDVKAIVISAGNSGILPAIQKIKEKRPDMIVVTAPIWDDPDMMAKYVDLSLDTDWVRRGQFIAEKAKKMGAKTFIHYSFPTHVAKEVISKRREMMKQTCAKIGLKFVEVLTPDPQAGSNRQAMLQFLQEDIPRQIKKYGKDTAVFGTNCPMQDVIIAKAMELGFIMPEQCCPTPLQGFPAALGLTIKPEDTGDFAKINAMIKDKVKAGNMTGRLSTWPVSVSIFLPTFGVEAAKAAIEKKIDLKNIDQVKALAKEVAGVNVTFNPMKPGMTNYYLIIIDSII
ncbi:MAG TPA: DUF3798 domain-containing protein, partial [Spirochaetota bacterium]|nr:DUF3798 domain-containing protein [Spirochaetota bacterium]